MNDGQQYVVLLNAYYVTLTVVSKWMIKCNAFNGNMRYILHQLYRGRDGRLQKVSNLANAIPQVPGHSHTQGGLSPKFELSITAQYCFLCITYYVPII